MKSEHYIDDAKEDVYPKEVIYPIHSLDDTKVNRCTVTWMMRFNDVLDPQKLNAALSKLLDIGDWKKLGGRLRYKVHIPVPVHPSRTDPCLGKWEPRSLSSKSLWV